MRRALLALATVLAGSLASMVFVAPAQAGGCTYQSATVTSGSGSGVFTANGEAATSHCPEAQSASVQGHLEIDPDPVCGLTGEVLCHQNQQCGGTGILYGSTWVPSDGEPSPGPTVCVGGEQPPAPPQVTGVRVLQAFRQIPLPTPTLGTSPPDRVTLVNLPTIFYTDAAPFDREVRVLGRRVALHIEPVSYEWSVGQGVRFTTDWAGSRYQHGVTPQQDPDAYVTWSYTHAENGVPARVEVVWGATWSLDGKPMGRVPGTVTMTSRATSLTVREARGGPHRGVIRGRASPRRPPSMVPRPPDGDVDSAVDVLPAKEQPE